MVGGSAAGGGTTAGGTAVGGGGTTRGSVAGGGAVGGTKCGACGEVASAGAARGGGITGVDGALGGSAVVAATADGVGTTRACKGPPIERRRTRRLLSSVTRAAGPAIGVRCPSCCWCWSDSQAASSFWSHACCLACAALTRCRRPSVEVGIGPPPAPSPPAAQRSTSSISTLCTSSRRRASRIASSTGSSACCQKCRRMPCVDHSGASRPPSKRHLARISSYAAWAVASSAGSSRKAAFRRSALTTGLSVPCPRRQPRQSTPGTMKIFSCVRTSPRGRAACSRSRLGCARSAVQSST